ncbi:MAG: PIN domain-containing protein [Bifidobacteriaceae bacterium]|nr:PIN domain-containing protein [Bifidobacteriaceae bacterium]
MSVLDASAVLAYLSGEAGADVVGEILESGGAHISAANWSEVAQKSLAAGKDWISASALLDSFDVAVDPVTRQDAEWAAGRWRRGENLSLGDRLCLALAERLGAEALTADSQWAGEPRARLIR